MQPDGLIKKEILEDLQNKRSLAIKIILPLLLISPIAFSKTDVLVKAGVILGFVIFFGIFGSSVGFVRLKETKMMERMAVLPIPYWRLTLDYIVANTILDVGQIVLPFILIVFNARLSMKDLALSVVALLASVLVANTLGVLVGFLAKTSGEVHLYSIISVLLTVLLSGAISFIPIPTVITWFFPFDEFFLTFIGKGGNTLVILVLSVIPCFIWLGFAMFASKKIWIFS
ncbi:ABC transporter permease [uncultured Sphaerochaeta sp.]|uniref:ABC transporter permease n=1 Tax=uncultured Sphaerochaeta sp. TaxID=886478 RepID=UPI002A0A88EA|nr:ABC transporter permease [uncultured Sphaerochaeta sp.]